MYNSQYYMKELIFRNKTRLLFTLISFVVLGITFGLGIFVPALKFLELIPIAFILGFGFTSFLKNILPIKNILTFIAISIFLGLFLNTFVIFLLGTVGLNVGWPLLIFYLPIVAILNIVLFFRFNTEGSLKGYLKDTKLETIDIIWVGVFTLLFAMFVSTCLERYYFLWDGFTFWLLDAKYIFENQHLRDGSFVVLANNYLSFFSLQINYMYLLFGKIAEQSAGLISLVYAYTGVLLIFSYVINVKKSVVKKILVYIGVLAALYAFFTIHYLLMSMYADVFLSVVVLMYAMVLFNKEYKEKYYWQRFFVLILLASTIYLTKTHFFVFSLMLLAITLVYDFKMIWMKIKTLGKDYWFVFSIFLILLFTVIIGKYAFSISNETSFVQSVSQGFTIDKSILTNVKGVVKGMILNIPLIVAVLAFYLPITFLVKKGFGKEDFLKIGFLILMTAFTFAVYIFGIYPLSDGSMYRYLGLVYLALPLLFVEILPDFEIEKRWQKVLTVIIMMGSVGLILGQLAFHMGLDLNFTPNSGVYLESEAHKEYSDIVDEVRAILPEDSTLMVTAISVDGVGMTDNAPPGFFLRYYLLEYNDSPSYYTNAEGFPAVYLAQAPDYLLIYSYQGQWPVCDGILTSGKSYLVKFDYTQQLLEKGSCIANTEDVVEL